MMGLVNQDIQLGQGEFEKISDLVYKYCGINLHEGKKELVRARLAKRLRSLKLKSFNDYIKYAVSDSTGSEFISLIDSISTNLTSFYREKQHFDYLEKVFLPSIVARKAAKGNKKIRVWSAGCSSGEEPYTIALTLLDFFKNQPDWDIKILATDISTQVLEKAKQGFYSKERVAPVPPSIKNKYLNEIKKDGNKFYQVGDEAKSKVLFGRLNLMEEWPVKGPVDAIFCRNVMIYFDKATQAKLVNRYWQVLDNGGLLFTGHSESLTGIDHKFRYVKPTIYAR